MAGFTAVLGQVIKGDFEMTKMQAIAKMFFAVTGIYVFQEGMSFVSYPLGKEDPNKILLSFIILSLFFYWFIAYFLIFKSDRLAIKLGRGGEEADGRWVVRLFIAAAIFAGGLLLAGCIRKSYVLGDLFKTIAVLPTEICRWVSSNEMPTLLSIDSRENMQIAAWLVKMAAALYLLFGTKKFVRWQIDTLKRLNLAIKAD